MEIDRDEIISAQVALRSSTGLKLGGDVEITSENLPQFEPAQETIDRVVQVFVDLGFEAGPFVGIGFSITAPHHRFVELFQTPILRTKEGGLVSSRPSGAAATELPLDNLPAEIVPLLSWVVFESPAKLNF